MSINEIMRAVIIYMFTDDRKNHSREECVMRDRRPVSDRKDIFMILYLWHKIDTSSWHRKLGI
jgi:hypothetical protein